MNRAGYVLVGGRSSRMGRDKALLPLGGMPLARAIAAAVAQAAGSATLVGDPVRYGALGPAIADLYPDEGPLGGIVTALRHTRAEWNLIAACDMPELSAPFLRPLLDAAEAAGADALLPRGPSGRIERLCGVYRVSALEPMAAAFDSGIRRVSAAFRGMRVAVYPVAEELALQNVNTPEEWAGYAAR